MKGGSWISYCIAYQGPFLSVIGFFGRGRTRLCKEIMPILSLYSIDNRTNGRAGTLEVLYNGYN